MSLRENGIKNTLALGLMLVLSIVVFLLFYRETPPTNRELVSLALGVLLGSMKDVFNHYFDTGRTQDPPSKLPKPGKPKPLDPPRKQE